MGKGVTPKSSDTRTRLIEATSEVVREHGYARATTRAIADAAGVSEGTIYRHFSHKSELFFAAVLAANAPAMTWMEGLPAKAGTATLAENLGEALLHFASLRDDVVPLELSLRADPELAREHHERMRTSAAGALPGPPGLLARYLAAEQQRGRIRGDVDTQAAAIVLLSALIGMAIGPAEILVEDSEQLIRTTVDLVVSGMAP